MKQVRRPWLGHANEETRQKSRFCLLCFFVSSCAQSATKSTILCRLFWISKTAEKSLQSTVARVAHITRNCVTQKHPETNGFETAKKDPKYQLSDMSSWLTFAILEPQSRGGTKVWILRNFHFLNLILSIVLVTFPCRGTWIPWQACNLKQFPFSYY